MKSISARAAKNEFGRLIDTARAGPVTIEKHGRPVVVVMSVEEYERLNRGVSKKANAICEVSGRPEVSLTDREKEQLKAMIDGGQPLPPPPMRCARRITSRGSRCRRRRLNRKNSRRPHSGRRYARSVRRRRAGVGLVTRRRRHSSWRRGGIEGGNDS
jgi:prevent-host-death family protein